MIRDQYRRVLGDVPILDLVLVTAERDADSVSPRAVLVLERIGRDNDLPPAWWHEAGPDGQRRMARPLREVLDDLHRLGRA